MDNENINLNTQDDVRTAVTLISEGYAEMGSAEQITPAEQQHEEIRKRIEAKEFEGLSDIDLISYGLNQLAEDTTQRKNTKKELRKKQAEREIEQAKLFTSEPYDGSKDKF